MSYTVDIKGGDGFNLLLALFIYSESHGQIVPDVEDKSKLVDGDSFVFLCPESFEYLVRRSEEQPFFRSLISKLKVSPIAGLKVEMAGGQYELGLGPVGLPVGGVSFKDIYLSLPREQVAEYGAYSLTLACHRRKKIVDGRSVDPKIRVLLKYGARISVDSLKQCFNELSVDTTQFSDIDVLKVTLPPYNIKHKSYKSDCDYYYEGNRWSDQSFNSLPGSICLHGNEIFDFKVNPFLSLDALFLMLAKDIASFFPFGSSRQLALDAISRRFRKINLDYNALISRADTLLKAVQNAETSTVKGVLLFESSDSIFEHPKLLIEQLILARNVGFSYYDPLALKMNQASRLGYLDMIRSTVRQITS